MSVPNVLAIGSCRIFRPLRHLHESQSIKLINHGSHQWFTHTAASAVQYADLVQGKASLPDALRPAILETEMTLPHNLFFEFPRPDLVVVEVSTLKEHRLDGYSLNAHKVYGMAVDEGVPYRAVINGQTGDLPTTHVLKTMSVRYASASEVEAQLLYLRQELKAPLLTVDHLYTESEDGSPIPERTKVSSILAGLESTHGMAYYPTKDLIVAAGLEVALQDQNHYRPNFESLVAAEMLTRMKQVL